MKKLAKIIMAILALVLVLSVCACTQNEPEEKASDVPAEATAEPTAVPTAAPTAEPTEAPTPAPTAEPLNFDYEMPYVTKGLVALYEGYYNTAKGYNGETTTWADLSGNGNDVEDITLSDNVKWTEKGLYTNGKEIELPEIILDTVNDEEFTIEFMVTDFVKKGVNYATFINSKANDNLAFFIRWSDNVFEVKLNNAVGQRANTPKASEWMEGATVTITFCADDEICLYVNGELMSSFSAPSEVNAQGYIFIGHSEGTKTYEATYNSIRIYDRVLTEAEIAQNLSAFGKVASK